MKEAPNCDKRQYHSSKTQMVMARDFVVRRSELTVPGHSMNMMAKAASSNADQVMFDLEDACAVSQKVEARKTVVEALNTLDFKGDVISCV